MIEMLFLYITNINNIWRFLYPQNKDHVINKSEYDFFRFPILMSKKKMLCYIFVMVVNSCRKRCETCTGKSDSNFKN